MTNKRKILITGGELFNKGAQSMSFIAIDELKTRFPDHEIILVSEDDYKRNDQEKNQYNFTIFYDLFKILFGFGIYAKIKKVNKNIIYESKKILQETDMLIDISGYALGSNWNLASTLHYISKIRAAKKYGIKVFLMPQSFGPFDYKGVKGIFINAQIKNTLKYASIIYARESEGFDLLTKRFNLVNVRLSSDLVLQNEGIDLNKIYNNLPMIKKFEIRNSSVAIIPNMKNFKYGNKDEIIKLYKASIDKLLGLDKTIYLVRHSYEDIQACEIIKSRFRENEKVILLTEDYSCLEYDEMVKEFDYIIASRYHSIVHAYRQGIPCIALGWATKYYELLSIFNQERYVFDVREKVDLNKFLDKIDAIDEKYTIESTEIKENLRTLRGNNIFTAINR